MNDTKTETPPAPAAGSAVIDPAIRRQWTCDQCGATGYWDVNWSEWGSLLEADEAGRRVVVCSARCRAAADPETLWVRKYGEPPRTFFRNPGAGMAVPIRSRRRGVSVKLARDDWMALVHFVTGDLHNMEASEIKEQLTRILDSVQRSIAQAQNDPAHPPPAETPSLKPGRYRRLDAADGSAIDATSPDAPGGADRHGNASALPVSSVRTCHRRTRHRIEPPTKGR